MCKQFKLDSIVTFKGSIPDIHLNLYQYDYMVQPTHMECFSLSILESLLSNVPVITTRVGGNAEVIVSGKNGWLFEATDVEKLTEIIENIISRKNSIQNDIYKEIEEKYSLELMVENHIKLLEN
jgi:glycosyltransferase involved in cell wall biosynthesis